jgi:hypothetical protein
MTWSFFVESESSVRLYRISSRSKSIRLLKIVRRQPRIRETRYAIPRHGPLNSASQASACGLTAMVIWCHMGIAESIIVVLFGMVFRYLNCRSSREAVPAISLFGNKD